MKRRPRIWLIYSFTITLCLFFESPAFSIADDENGVDRFKFNTEDGLLLPVEIDGKTYSFLVDTGLSNTMFDLKLLRDKPIQEVTGRTHDGSEVPLRIHNVPVAKLGKSNLQDDLQIALGVDLTEQRKSSEREVYGLLGMDILGKRIVEIDFEKEELLLRKANNVANASTESLPITFDRIGIPTVSGEIDNVGPIIFVIGTTNMCYRSGDIGKSVASDLMGRDSLKVIGESSSQTLTGRQAIRVFRGHSLTLGKHQVANPIFGEYASEKNCLGLYYLSRFHVVMDFPNRQLYLRPNRLFDKPDVRNLSGIDVSRKEKKVVAETIRSGSIAEIAGMKAEDVILKVDGQDADKIRLLTLQKLFCQDGKVINLTIQRGEQPMEVTLELKDSAK